MLAPIKIVYNYYLVKCGNMFQAKLHCFLITVFVMMLFFMFIVFATIVYVMFNTSVVRYFGHKKSPIETVAFLLSGGALFLMSFPSMYLLYLSGSQVQPSLIVKIIGSQWYWGYEVGSIMEEATLVYIVPIDEIAVGGIKYLEVDNRLVLPVNTLIQFHITSSDVIHSFAIPSLGIKVDATPGLLTVVHAYLTKVGTHYGQCYEICGINHSYMPFCIEVVPIQSFMYWVLVELPEVS